MSMKVSGCDMGELQSNVKKIYGLLGDELSKYIFEERIMYSLIGDMKYIRNIVSTMEAGKKFYEQLQKDKRYKAIFGVTGFGRQIVRTYDDIKFECFIDNRKNGESYEGLPVISLEEFKMKYPDSLIILANVNSFMEIYQQLLLNGICEEDIVKNPVLKRKEFNSVQYFDLPQVYDRKFLNEVFLDGGSYDGRNALEFMKKIGGELVLWEPDSSNQEKCAKTLKENGIEYELIPKGLWSESTKLKFNRGTGGSSAINACGDIEIEVDSVDSLITKPVSFIKMDIEGAEYQAILGAKNMISKYTPRLAISVYHKPEDIWEIPLLIHSINPQYTFYLRHYSFYRTETVLYAL